MINYFINRMLGVVLILCMLSGCGLINRDSDATNPHHYGTKGVTLTFVNNMPGPEVYEGESFILGVEAHNEGAYNIDEGYLQIQAPYPLQFIEWEYGSDLGIGYEATVPVYLFGRSKGDQTGEKTLMTARMRALSLLPGQESQTKPVRVTACYLYKNIFAEEVCIDPREGMPGIDTEGGCKPQTVRSGGQGGPVGVSKVEVSFDYTGGEADEDMEIMRMEMPADRILPIFTIYLKNFGKGTIVDPQQVGAACGLGEIDTITEHYPVRFTAYYFDLPLVCDFQDDPYSEDDEPGVIIPEEGEARFSCWLREGIPRGQTSFYVPLVVEFDYGYKITETRDIRVVAKNR
jgi:hypothetical protein